jgi:hypothetical protein
MNPDRMIVGVATCFGVRAHNGTFWRRDMFDPWLRLDGQAVPLRVDHAPLIGNGGVLLNVGAARRFAAIKEPVNGLLALCEVADGPWGDAILEDVARHLEGPEWPPSYGFSIGAKFIPGEIVLPFELSLTLEPGFSQALVLDVGPQSQDVWDALTGAPIGVRP